MSVKKCSKCGVFKELEYFCKKYDSADLLASQCKSCQAAYKAAYRAANRDKITARQAAYQAANRDKITARKAAYRAANRDYIKEYAKARRHGIDLKSSKRFFQTLDAVSKIGKYINQTKK
jgi:hypothetical protein